MYLSGRGKRNVGAPVWSWTGHRVLLGEAETRRFIALPLGSELSRLHQHQGLNCEAWAWVNGRAVRFCTDPQRLRSVQIDTRHAASGLDASEHQRLFELEASRDYAMTRWLGSGRLLPRSRAGVFGTRKNQNDRAD